LITSGAPVLLQSYAITSNADFTPVAVTLPEGDATVGQTGWRTNTVTLDANQLSTVRGLEFDIFDVGDNALTSELLIDDVRIDWAYDCGAAGKLTQQQAEQAIRSGKGVLDAASLAVLRNDPCAALVPAGTPAKNDNAFCNYHTGKPDKNGTAICFSLADHTLSEPFLTRTNKTSRIATGFDDVAAVPINRQAGQIHDYTLPVLVFGHSRAHYAYGQEAPATSLAEVNTITGVSYVPFVTVTMGSVAGELKIQGDKAVGTKSFSNAGRIGPDGACKTGETCYQDIPDFYVVSLNGLVHGVRHELQVTYQFGSVTRQGLSEAQTNLF